MLVLTLLVTLSAVLCASASAAASSPLPGQALVWSNAHVSGPRYVTRSVDEAQLSQWIAAEGRDAELVVLFTQEQAGASPCREVQQLLASAGGAAEPTVFKYVYGSPALSPSLPQALQRAAHSEALLVVPPESIDEQALSALLQNGQTDLVHVPLSAQKHPSAQAAQTLRSLLANTQGKKVLFAAVDENNAVVRPAEKGEFARVLQEGEGETDPIYVYGDPLYKPEGAEYSIYYAGQYLYITPDIFTGLLTSLFIAFTLLTGLSCLGSIQGMSSFYDKLPAVGKEA